MIFLRKVKKAVNSALFPIPEKSVKVPLTPEESTYFLIIPRVKMVELKFHRKNNYFRFAIAITIIPMIDAPTVANGDNGA